MVKYVLFFVLYMSATVVVAAPESEHRLDGVVIKGTLKATNAWLRVGVKGTITFKEGRLYWSTEKKGEPEQTMAYRLESTDACLLFKAEGLAEPGSSDEIQWQGCYDGVQLFNVTARWTRVEKDFIHDLMLPDVVYFSFTPEQPDKS